MNHKFIRNYKQREINLRNYFPRTEIASNERYELNEIINEWVTLRETYKMRTLTSC